MEKEGRRGRFKNSGLYFEWYIYNTLSLVFFLPSVPFQLDPPSSLPKVPDQGSLPNTNSAYVFVGLRFLSRSIGSVKLAANHWLIVFALAFTTVLAASSFMEIRLGAEKHMILATDPKAMAIVCSY